MVLPEGLEFLKLGWWLIHILGVLLVWSYAYRKGRLDERRSHAPESATQAEASAAAARLPAATDEAAGDPTVIPPRP
jgi:hypothetical protein